MLQSFPAVLIGGPPHSGKSVFVYSLTRALRRAQMSHYVLRACPDGEGDWSNEADQALVRTIRAKGKFNEAFTARVERYLQNRHLPLLVDVGGRPTLEQQYMFRHCTHAILLISGHDNGVYERELAKWRTMMAKQGIEIVAELRSLLPGVDELVQTTPMISGTISHLERGKTAVGSIMDACVDKLSTLFRLDERAVAQLHLSQAPVELSLNLPALARTLGSSDGYWQPEQLPALLDYLPEQKPLALYGRSVNWVNAALAMLAYPAPLWLFDVRLGWVQLPMLPMAAVDREQLGWEATVEEAEDYWLLTIKTNGQYLDYEEPETLPLPMIERGKGLVLSGQIPHWLLTAVTRQLAPHHSWTAVYQPSLGAAIVVYSKATVVPIGHKIQVK